uniref:Uncharacterized protein n=1 Tax=Rhizophora mucronata TaxID=61149 RepID=A0A2P2KU44_RHIMU
MPKSFSHCFIQLTVGIIISRVLCLLLCINCLYHSLNRIFLVMSILSFIIS